MIPPRPPLPPRTGGAKKVRAGAYGLINTLPPHSVLIPLTLEIFIFSLSPAATRR